MIRPISIMPSEEDIIDVLDNEYEYIRLIVNGIPLSFIFSDETADIPNYKSRTYNFMGDTKNQFYLRFFFDNNEVHLKYRFLYHINYFTETKENENRL